MLSRFRWQSGDSVSIVRIRKDRLIGCRSMYNVKPANVRQIWIDSSGIESKMSSDIICPCQFCFALVLLQSARMLFIIRQIIFIFDVQI